ncbi:hypothetical protein [Pseudomonas putida]|uniref:hypothetical protein n=1 Tax=Pseudomonas putida TaxID=303 RepID=UPI000A5487CC|nr:hypothetical protein [Pseudomonas putida]
MITSVTPKAIDITTAEQTAIQLRKAGATYDQIKEATGLSDRKVKETVKDIPKPKQPRNPNSRAESPFNKSIERVLPIAIRTQGIRDYELRDILHEEYGSVWNTSTGLYESKYTSDNLKRVKAKVREQALELGCNALFIPDWIDKFNPTASSKFLISAATDLMSRVDEHVNEYMVLHGTSQNTDCKQGMLARRKQYYAVRQHLLKLAIQGYGQEPVQRLLDRTTILVGELEGTPDIPVTDGCHQTGARVSKEPTKFYPEPTRKDAFLDFVEAQGWIKA